MTEAKPYIRGEADGLWPTDTQMLVLKAALMPAAQALPAFETWLTRIDLEADFDQGTFRLLPLMYENLRRLGVEHPLMGRLKGVYRLTWYKNNKLYNDLSPVVAALQSAGIPTMLLKGVPLIDGYYGNIAVRPMADIDLLVPEAFAPKALQVMEAFAYDKLADPTVDYLRYRHALGYWSKQHGEFDLHWHVFAERRQSEADAVFWDNARRISFNGIDTLAPDATRMFLHTLVHGFRWNREPPIRWIADAMMILRKSAAELDWDAMVDYAIRHQIDYRFRLPLLFLKQHFEAAIPDSVLAALARKPTWVQRIEATSVLRNPTRLHNSPIGHFWLVVSDYCRFAQASKPLPFAVGFTHYLRFRWGLRGRSEMPLYVGRGILKRVKRFFGGPSQMQGGL